MTDTIRELTEKIYTEGVEKAVREAEKIIAEAQKEAGNILDSARLEKSRILEQATGEANDLKRKTDSEIRLAAQKLIGNLKLQATNMLVLKQVDSFAAVAFEDEKFVQEMMLLVVQNWAAGNREETDLCLLIPEKEEKKVAAFFESKLFSELNRGIEIKIDPGTKNGFKISPKDGHYILSFTEKDFENYFRNYLKEKTSELLFGSR